jgi:hypothetical protein
MADQTYDPQKDASAQEPLTDNEKKLVTRLFGDPFAFPMEFKAWLRGWLEEQFPRIGTLASPAPVALTLPAGAILDYGGDTAPEGYLICDGAQYDNTQPDFNRLFAVIGFRYGSGSTDNHFRVPDLPDNKIISLGS